MWAQKTKACFTKEIDSSLTEGVLDPKWQNSQSNKIISTEITNDEITNDHNNRMLLSDIIIILSLATKEKPKTSFYFSNYNTNLFNNDKKKRNLITFIITKNTYNHSGKLILVPTNKTENHLITRSKTRNLMTLCEIPIY